MSKGHDGVEKSKEPHKEHPEGEAKKHGDAKHPAEGVRSNKAKGHTPMPGGCFSWNCKSLATRFNFCPEHYEHFKFGLIKKTGEPVSDYEKKIEHYLSHKNKKDAQRVA